MNSHMDHFDVFLNSKDVLIKDETFDLLDDSGTPALWQHEDWCLDEDKILESIRYGDKLPEGALDDVEVDTTEALEATQHPAELISYSLAEDVLSPCSASSSGSVSSDQFEPDHNHNVKVFQLVSLPPGVKVRAGHAIQIVQQEDVIEEEVLDASPSSTSDHQTSFHELKLSDEEKRLLSKEGIALPTHYPLTKFEERELKRIRRKIRNKISAQDSRKRKKEYLDKLQQKVQEVEDEKSSLAKKVRSLEQANSKLSAQVKRLQIALTNATKNPPAQNANGVNHNSVVPAATTLLVLILSLALVVLPTVHNNNKKQTSHMDDAVRSALEDSNPNTSIPGRSRTMMGVPVGVQHKVSSFEWDMEDVDEPPMKRFSFQPPSKKEPGSGKHGGLPMPSFPSMELIGAHIQGLKQGPVFSDLMNELDD